MSINKIQNSVDALPLAPTGEWGFFRGVNGELQYNFTGLASGTKVLLSSGLAPLAVTTATVTLGPTHVGRTVLLNRAAGIAFTLPAASGTGNVYNLLVQATFTGAASVAVANANDFMIGVAQMGIDGGTFVPHQYPTANTGTLATESDTISMFGTANSTGGFKGATVRLQDVAANLWSVVYTSDAGGTEANPFTAGV